MAHNNKTQPPIEPTAPSIQGNDVVLKFCREEIPWSMKAAECEAALSLSEYTIDRDDNRPLQFQGYFVGQNEVNQDIPRGTLVRIFVTKRGRIVTAVHQWQKDVQRNRERHAAAVHDSPEMALKWLAQDGGGHLGRASREAWEVACCVWPGFKGHEVEVVE